MSDINPEHLTDEVVEKAAEEIYEELQHPNWRAPLWDEIDEHGRERFLDVARAALSAVAPLIAAQALRDAAVFPGSQLSYAAREWLRDRADRIEVGSDDE